MINLKKGDTIIFKSVYNGWLPLVMNQNKHILSGIAKPYKIVLIECISSKKYNYTSSNRYIRN